MTTSRRDFILNVLRGSTALYLAPMATFAGGNSLIKTPKGVKNWIISTSVRPDGMTCIWGAKGEYLLLRNHEIDEDGGGVTAVTMDKNLKVLEERWCLTGTSRNCSGGKTKWNTWLTCEETFAEFKKKHGYVYEVDPDKSQEKNSTPLTAMGRFNHEACGHHEASGYIYMTEDRPDSCFYRFIPKNLRDLKKGGTLEALVIEGEKSSALFKQGHAVKCSWMKIENPDPVEDTIRSDAQKKGATLFVRGEGITVSQDDIIFTCTTGGENGLGQIFSYNHKTHMLEVLYQPKAESFLRKPDNLTFNHYGDLLVCEDGDGLNRIVGITPEKKVYVIAESMEGEWAGVCMSPDNKYVFANLQSPGQTYAFQVPWESLR